MQKTVNQNQEKTGSPCKPSKKNLNNPISEIEDSDEFLTLSAIILLVCKHPDSLITNIVTLSGISISSWKNPRLCREKQETWPQT